MRKAGQLRQCEHLDTIRNSETHRPAPEVSFVRRTAGRTRVFFLHGSMPAQDHWLRPAIPARSTVSRSVGCSTGGDYNLTRHFALRADYRGLVYERPDFDLQALHSGPTTHTAQPSAGIVAPELEFAGFFSQRTKASGALPGAPAGRHRKRAATNRDSCVQTDGLVEGV